MELLKQITLWARNSRKIRMKHHRKKLNHSNQRDTGIAVSDPTWGIKVASFGVKLSGVGSARHFGSCPRRPAKCIKDLVFQNEF